MTALRKHGDRSRRPTLTVATVVVTLLTTLALSAPAAIASAPNGAISEPCVEYPDGVPREAYILVDYLRSHNFTPPPNWVGGRGYRGDDPFFSKFDDRQRLLEFDVYPKVQGQPRRAERIVLIPSKLVRNGWYSPDHYNTFIDMYDLGCLGVGSIHVPFI